MAVQLAYYLPLTPTSLMAVGTLKKKNPTAKVPKAMKIEGRGVLRP